MSAHTPGPWLVASGTTTVYALNEGFNRFTACVQGVHILSSELEANARLIAAAPDLYEALKAIVELDDGDKPDLWHFEKEFEQARAAIAKAKP